MGGGWGGSINTFSTILRAREANSRKRKDSIRHFMFYFILRLGIKIIRCRTNFLVWTNFWKKVISRLSIWYMKQRSKIWTTKFDSLVFFGFQLEIIEVLDFLKPPFIWRHSCLKWPLEEIYNLIFEHLTYSAILVPNWTTWQKYFSWTHFSTEMIETFWGGKEDASLARNNFLGCQETLELLEKG